MATTLRPDCEPAMHHIYLDVDPERSSIYTDEYPCGIVPLYDYEREDVKVSNPICICNSTGLVANWCVFDRKLKPSPGQVVLRAHWDDEAQRFKIGLQSTPELESTSFDERYRLIKVILTFMAFRQNAGTNDFLRYNTPTLFPLVEIPVKYLTARLILSNSEESTQILTRKYVSTLDENVDIGKLRPSMESLPPPRGQPLPTKPRPSNVAKSNHPATVRMSSLQILTPDTDHHPSIAQNLPRPSIATIQPMLVQRRLMQPVQPPPQIPQARNFTTTSTRACPQAYIDLTTEYPETKHHELRPGERISIYVAQSLCHHESSAIDKNRSEKGFDNGRNLSSTYRPAINETAQQSNRKKKMYLNLQQSEYV